MNVENCIEAQYRELMECSEPNAEYADLYKAFTHPHLREILTTLHHDLILLFKRMNDRLPTQVSVKHTSGPMRVESLSGVWTSSMDFLGLLKELPLLSISILIMPICF